LGEMKNMDRIYREYAETVYKYLFCLTHDAELAEELTQETFYQAMKTINNFRGDCKLSVWLCQIAKNMWRRDCAKKNKNKSIPLDDIEFKLSAKENIEEDILKNEDKLTLFRKLHSLNEKTKEVMYLRLTGELSFREIGDIVNRSENWARVTFYRGKQKILKEGDK
jgi:RNA polymerase sigma factor (sigma-70 family)